jgi:PHAX RNA-binding domain
LYVSLRCNLHFYKFYLFSVKIVQVLGKEKSMELFTLTQNVEAAGGMLIMVNKCQIYKFVLYNVCNNFQNQTRRRTSGGVFLFHVRNSCNSDQCMEIFEDNRREHEKARRAVRAQKRKEAHKVQNQCSNNNTGAAGRHILMIKNFIKF